MAGTDWRELELSSGVKLLYGPFTHGLYWDIMSRALDEHPDPDMPKREIEVLGGTEEVDDDENAEYTDAMNKSRLARYELLGQAVLDLCVEVVGWPDEWKSTVERITDKYSAEGAPEDPAELKVWFLTKYALRTTEDWKIVGLVQRFSQIDDEEVRQRAEFFRSDVEGAEDSGVDASGPAEE